MERVFMLASEVVGLEARLRATMEELKALVTLVDDDDMMRLLVAIMRQPDVSRSALSALTIVVPPPPKAPDLAAPRPNTLLEDTKERVCALMGDGRERSPADVVRSLKLKRSRSTVYAAIADLSRSGRLLRVAYARYRTRA